MYIQSMRTEQSMAYGNMQELASRSFEMPVIYRVSAVKEQHEKFSKKKRKVPSKKVHASQAAIDGALVELTGRGAMFNGIA